MDVASILSQLQSLAQAHPYLVLAILLLLFGAIVSNKLASYILYFLAFLAMLQEFGLVETLISFLKEVPSMVESLLSVFGGG
ncbi:MAG: t26-9p [Thermoproteota archaeon]|nr:MAG: t26-9p [Candidatus Korarchaeota archaeon]